MNLSDPTSTAIFSTCKESLSNCPNDDCGAGINNFGSTACYDDADDSIIICSCPKCDTKWYICRYCSGNYTYVLRSLPAAKSHMKRLHKDRIPSLSPPKRKRRPAVDQLLDDTCKSRLSSKFTTEITQQQNPSINHLTKTLPLSVPNPVTATTILVSKLPADNYSFGSDDYALPSQIEFEGYDSELSTVDNNSLSSLYNDSSSPCVEHEQCTTDCTPTTIDVRKETSSLKQFFPALNSYESLHFHGYNDSMSSFYAKECTELYSGLKSIIAKAYHVEDSIDTISMDELRFQMLNAQFISSLTRKQQEDYSKIMDLMESLFINPNIPKKTKFICQIPNCYNDLRRNIVIGKFSIMKNIPLPKITMLAKHSFASLKDCISHFLLQPNTTITPSNSDNVPGYLTNSIFNTDVCNKIFLDGLKRANALVLPPNYPLVTVYIVVWSDAFEPNKSIKADRHSVWLMTVTLFVMDSSFQPIFSTYPISFGKEGTCHDEVYSNLLEELTDLRSGDFIVMHSYFLKKPVLVHADIFSVSNDQPERRSSLKLAAGNSTFHNRWGYSCYTKQLVHVLKACPTCTHYNELQVQQLATNYSSLMSDPDFYSWRFTNCCNCTNWWLFDKSDLLKIQPPKEFSFPADQLDENGCLRPFKLTFKRLTEAIDYVHQSVINNQMKKTEAVNFLKYHCLNNDTIELVYSAAYTSLCFNLAENNKDNDPITYEDICDDKLAHPRNYDKFPVPSNWKLFPDLNRHPEMPMHLLFLGVVKTVIIDIMTWLKCQKKFNTFFQMANGVLNNVKSLQLSWLKILPFINGKLGGWVAENYLGMSRIMKWFFELLLLLPEPEAYADPSTEPATWNKKQSVAWLTARGIDSAGSAKELKQKILIYFDQNNIPEILALRGCSATIVLKMVSALHHLISLCMKLTGSSIEKMLLESSVRVFLSYYAQMEESIYCNAIPRYLSSYNFMSLLNLPEQVQQYRSLRYLWEGKQQGEGYLRSVKSEFKIGLNKNWKQWLLENLLREKSFNNICSNIFNDQSLKNSVVSNKDIILYNNKNEAWMHTFTPRPFSAIMLGQQYYIGYKKDSLFLAMELLLSPEENYPDYYSIGTGCDTGEEENTIILDEATRSSLVPACFLPRLCTRGYPVVHLGDPLLFCVVVSDWNYNDS